MESTGYPFPVTELEVSLHIGVAPSAAKLAIFNVLFL